MRNRRGAPASGEDPTADELPGSKVSLPTAEARIETFVTHEHRRVTATVALWADSFDDAGDAVAEALARAWERLEHGESIESLAAWITRVATNEVRSGLRRKMTRRHKAHLVAVADRTDDGSGTHAEHLDLRRALRTLTARQREVVTLFYAVDLGIAEIGAQLGISEGTVKATLSQSRRALGERLTQPRRSR